MQTVQNTRRLRGEKGRRLRSQVRDSSPHFAPKKPRLKAWGSCENAAAVINGAVRALQHLHYNHCNNFNSAGTGDWQSGCTKNAKQASSQVLGSSQSVWELLGLESWLRHILPLSRSTWCRGWP